MAKFAIGEIAIVIPPSHHEYNQDWYWIYNHEVEVVSGLCPTIYGPGYIITSLELQSRFPNIRIYGAEIHLRKRPQPPDWEKIAEPKDLPVEEIA